MAKRSSRDEQQKDKTSKRSTESKHQDNNNQRKEISPPRTQTRSRQDLTQVRTGVSVVPLTSPPAHHDVHDRPDIEDSDHADGYKTASESTMAQAHLQQSLPQAVQTKNNSLSASDPSSQPNTQTDQEVPRLAGSRCVNSNCPLLSYFKTRSAGLDNAPGIPMAEIDSMQDGSVAALPQTPLANVYKPLTPWQTRLLELLPVTDERPYLRVRLFCVELADIKGVGVTGTSDVVEYTALSHVWGTSDQQSLMICNDQKVAVSKKLVEALFSLAREGDEQYLWVDSLCINESDPKEKAKQVRIMLRIFEKADRVIAWIENGSLLSRAPLLMDDFNRCHNRGHAHECIMGWQQVRRDLLLLASDDLWTRTWCRQEIFAAEWLTLSGPSSGLGELELDDFRGALRLWLNSEKPKLSSPDEIERDVVAVPKRLKKCASSDIPTAFTNMTKNYMHAGTDHYSYRAPPQKTRYSIHWLRHLRDGAAFKATDERDRVYGAFGMISSPTTRTYVEDKPEIWPDDFPISYQKTVSEVYQDVVKYLINTDQNLDCLTVFEDRRARAENSDLPSWVTDWRCDQPRALLNKAPDQDKDQKTYGMAVQQNLDRSSGLRVEGSVLFSVQELSARGRVDLEAKDEAASSRKKAASQSKTAQGSVHDLDTDPSEISRWYITCKDETLSGLSTIYVPHTTRLEDIVVWLWGGCFLFVLRPRSAGRHEMVGPAILPPSSSPIAWDPGHKRKFVLV